MGVAVEASTSNCFAKSPALTATCMVCVVCCIHLARRLLRAASLPADCRRWTVSSARTGSSSRNTRTSSAATSRCTSPAAASASRRCSCTSTVRRSAARRTFRSRSCGSTRPRVERSSLTTETRSALPLPHLRRDWAHPAHICAGTGLTPAHIGTGTMPHTHRAFRARRALRCAVRPPVLLQRVSLRHSRGAPHCLDARTHARTRAQSSLHFGTAALLARDPFLECEARRRARVAQTRRLRGAAQRTARRT